MLLNFNKKEILNGFGYNLQTKKYPKVNNRESMEGKRNLWDLCFTVFLV